MRLRMLIGLTVVVTAAVVLIAIAGATPTPTGKQRLHFRSTAAVLKYLKSKGVNVRVYVIQRGSHNYAGPACPGKRWNCTRATHVIQFASTATASNNYSCSAASCSTIQVAPPGGNNNAKCYQVSSGVDQSCSITQTNTNVSAPNDNNATWFQLISQGSNQSQTAKQHVDVTQTNGTGKNTAVGSQVIAQSTSTHAIVVNQAQDGRQETEVNQNSGTGNQLSIWSQAVGQKAKASSDNDWHAYSPSTTTASGTQNQYGDGSGSVDQSSAGVSKSFSFQNMGQSEQAPTGVTQTQVGPFKCCSLQQSNPNDEFQIQQSKFQFANANTLARSQFLDMIGNLDTSGHGHISQFGNQNGTTQSTSCDVNAGSCSAATSISDGVPSTCSTTDGSCNPDLFRSTMRFRRP